MIRCFYHKAETVSFFLWVALKGKAYAKKPRTIQELENNIRREIAAISEDILQATFALPGQWWRTFPTSPLVSTCFS
jgi:hypothetical protein